MWALPPCLSPRMGEAMRRGRAPAPPSACACFYDEDLRCYRFAGSQVVHHGTEPLRTQAVWGVFAPK
eukprot:1739888-Alexandrium_andersonii.AAC.1